METSDHGSYAGDAVRPSSVLRYAAQPDIVLSHERDLYYANTLLGEGASELAETLLGSRRVMILAPELRALASCLYFGLTNLAGEMLMDLKRVRHLFNHRVWSWVAGRMLDPSTHRIAAVTRAQDTSCTQRRVADNTHSSNMLEHLLVVMGGNVNTKDLRYFEQISAHSPG